MNNLQSFDPRITLKIEGGLNRNPVERTEKVAKLYHHARELAASMGFELGEQSVGGASDGNFVAAFDVPVLDGLGPDGDGAHSANEYILISDIPRRAALLASLIASL
jgi:glutamate carboxypeptidase